MGDNEECDQKEGKGQQDVNLKKPGVIGALYLKTAAKVGLVEHTKLEQDFLESIKTLENYRKIIDQLLNAYELISQPNPKVVDSGRLNEEAQADNPYMKLGTHVEMLATYMHTKQEKASLLAIAALFKKMTTVIFQGREKIRSLTNNTRRFVTSDYEEMTANRKALDSALLTMDDMRQQMKKSATRPELEERGASYVAAVRQFNKAAEEIDKAVEGYAETCFFHERENIRFHMGRMAIHEELAKMIEGLLKPAPAPKTPAQTTPAANAAPAPPKKKSQIVPKKAE